MTNKNEKNIIKNALVIIILISTTLFLTTSIYSANKLDVCSDVSFFINTTLYAKRDIAETDFLGNWSKVRANLSILLPDNVSIDALDYFNGNVYFSLAEDTIISNLYYFKDDIIEYNGSTISCYWRGNANGLSDNANMDALNIISLSPFEFVASFDTDLYLDSISTTVPVKKADIVHFVIGSGWIAIDFSAVSAGLAEEANIDAFCRKSNAEWLISFDSAGNIGALQYEKGDILWWNPDVSSFDSSPFFRASANSIPDNVNITGVEFILDIPTPTPVPTSTPVDSPTPTPTEPTPTPKDTPTPSPTPKDTSTPTPTPSPTPTGPNDHPFIKIFSPSQIEEIGLRSYRIKWFASDIDSDAKISLYYDNDNSGFDGINIALGISEDFGVFEYVWDLSSVSRGIYWIYGVADDYVNPPVYAYSSGTVLVYGISKDDIIECILGKKNLLPEELKYYDINKDNLIDIADLIQYITLSQYK